MFGARLSPSPGRGRLVRSGQRCLFVPHVGDADGTDDSVLDEFVSIFQQEPTSTTAIADFVLARSRTAPGFVIVSWTSDESGRGNIHLIVRGDITVTTDLPSVPSLSGLGSSTWVEHRVPRRPERARLVVGPPAPSFGDLVSGIVAADGFELSLELDAWAESDPTEPSESVKAFDDAVAEDPELPESSLDGATSTPRSAVESSANSPQRAPVEPEVAEQPHAETPTHVERPKIIVADHPPTSHETAATGRLAALNAAAGRAPETSNVEVEEEYEGIEAEPDSVEHMRGDDHAPGTPPARPDFFAVGTSENDADAHQASETTLAPDAQLDDVFETSDSTPLIDARTCPEGHPNPPHLLRCRSCRRSLDLNVATITVEQPVLAIAELPDGTRLELAGTTVLGRNPRSDAVRDEPPHPHRLVALDAPASVSRTHAMIVANGWTLTAIDCASKAGTALIADGDDEPVGLEPWIPHELSGGDVIFLGGPTAIRLHEVDA